MNITTYCSRSDLQGRWDLVSIARPAIGSFPAPTASLADFLWQRISARLELDFGGLEAIIANLFERPLSGSEVAEALRLSRSLSATLTKLGVGAAADLVRSTAIPMDQSDIGSKEAIALAAILDDARLALASTVADTRLTSETGNHLLVISSPQKQADDLMWVAIGQGLKVTYHENAMRPLAKGERPPDMIVVAVPEPDLGQAYPLLRAISETYGSTPLIVLSPRSTLEQRLRGARLASTIVQIDTDPVDVLSELRLALARIKQSYEVVAIGKSSDWLSARLTANGLTARVERSPGAAFRAIAAGEARAIVIVQDAGSLTAVEMTALLRADIATREVTIVVVADKSVSTSDLFAAGADTVFGKDADLNDLTISVKSHLVRSVTAEARAAAQMKQVTLKWPPAVVLIERLLMGSMRRNSPVGFAVIQLEEDRNSNRDDQIVNEFRRGDVVARYDDRHLVIVLGGASRKTLVARMSSLVEQYKLRSVGGRIACLEFPIDGRSVQDLVTGGFRMLDRSSENKGPTVVGADWRPDGERPPDVLIVDPDMTLGSVLKATMERRGLHVEHEPDSLLAINYLTGETDRPLPRVVVLELEQQGVSGMQFLRQIRASGNLGFIKVVVLSSRTIEADMRQAFEMGVADYVAKPFSTPLLLHRIQRVLDS